MFRNFLKSDAQQKKLRKICATISFLVLFIVGGCNTSNELIVPGDASGDQATHTRMLSESCVEIFKAAVVDFKREQFEAAIERLLKSKSYQCRGLHEHARADQLISLAYLEFQAYDISLEFMISAIESNQLDKALHEQSLYSAAKISYLLGDYRQALTYIKSYQTSSLRSMPAADALKARSLYAMGRKDEALTVLGLLYEQHLTDGQLMRLEWIEFLEKLRSESASSAG